MKKIKKCKVTRYDKSITEPPFLTIQIDEFEVLEPETDHLGEEFASRLISACSSMNYVFKFYCLCLDEGHDYEVVVY